MQFFVFVGICSNLTLVVGDTESDIQIASIVPESIFQETRNLIRNERGNTGDTISQT